MKAIDISATKFENAGSAPWYGNAENIKSVTIEEKIVPEYTRRWFEE